MNKPVFPSYQELLNEEAVSVPDALRLDTQPVIRKFLILICANRLRNFIFVMWKN